MTRHERMMMIFRRFLKSTNLYSRELMLLNQNNGYNYLPTQLKCSLNGNCTQKDYEWLDLFMPYAMEDLEDFLRKHYRISLTNEGKNELQTQIKQYRIGATLLEIAKNKGILTNRWSLDRDLERFLKNTNL